MNKIKARDRDELLIRLDERSGAMDRRVCDVQKRVKGINGDMRKTQEIVIETRTKLDDHLINEKVHSKLDADSVGLLGKTIIFLLKIIKKV